MPYETVDQLAQITLSQMKQVFAVQKVSIKNDRPANFYRELAINNYKDPNPKPIVETYPGLPTYELTLERIILYSGNLVEALGFENAGHDVFQQYKPLLMAFELFQPPASANDAAGSVTYMYHGCWLQNNPLDFDITQDDLKMIQSINIIAAGVKRS